MAVTLALVFCIAIAGPFATYTAFPFWDRVAYWGTVIFMSLPVSMTIRQTLFRFGLRENSWPYGLSMVPLMAVVYGSFVWVFSHNYPRLDRDLIPNYPLLLLIVGLVALIVTLARVIYADNAEAVLNHRLREMGLPADVNLAARQAAVDALIATDFDDSLEDTDNDLPPRLMRRLPVGAVGPIHRLEASNHFVRVVTAVQTYEIRLRFADAIDEMDGVAGLCPHRSHWVRLESVVAAEREGAKLCLRTMDGACVPVSRGYRDRVEAAGLISPAMLAAASETERLAAQ